MNTGTRRRHPFAALMLAFAIALAGAFGAAPARADEPLQEEGIAAVEAWIHAVATGDPVKFEALTAPEFQIVRGDGSAHDRATYLTDLPVLESIPAMHDVVVTKSGEQMVVRYAVHLSKDVDGKNVNVSGPRLTVLRQQDGIWLVVAHANFAAVVQE